VVEYFECLGCHAVTEVNAVPPKCMKCGGGWGIVRSNIRVAVERIIGDAAPNGIKDPRAVTPAPPLERRKN
jgi:hypothetical protein